MSLTIKTSTFHSNSRLFQQHSRNVFIVNPISYIATWAMERDGERSHCRRRSVYILCVSVHTLTWRAYNLLER